MLLRELKRDKNSTTALKKQDYSTKDLTKRLKVRLSLKE